MACTNSHRYFASICFICICVYLSLITMKPYFNLQRRDYLSYTRMLGDQAPPAIDTDVTARMLWDQAPPAINTDVTARMLWDKAPTAIDTDVPARMLWDKAPPAIDTDVPARMLGDQAPTAIDTDVTIIHTHRNDSVCDACSPSTRICSTSGIKNCADARNYFPQENHWTNLNATLPGSRFLPTFCRYKHDLVPPRELQRCLQNKPIQHIVVIGDSHGRGYFLALQKCITPIADCTLRRNGSSKHYFSRRKRNTIELPKQKTHERLHFLYECVFAKPTNNSENGSSDRNTGAGHPHSVLIERIDIVSFEDMILPDDCPHAATIVNATGRCAPRMLFKTLFADYFGRDHRYPDVILYFSNSHDKGLGKTLDRIRSEMVLFRDAVRRYVPRSTSFYWFNHLSENDLKKKSDWQNVLYEGKYTANEMIVRVNRAMYDVLRDDIRTNRIHTFFDLYTMTLPLAEWSRDGIHLHINWYIYLMSYWFQTACSTFM